VQVQILLQIQQQELNNQVENLNVKDHLQDFKQACKTLGMLRAEELFQQLAIVGIVIKIDKDVKTLEIC